MYTSSYRIVFISNYFYTSYLYSNFIVRLYHCIIIDFYILYILSYARAINSY